jgi:3-hydroxyisobutyrate dehydrogenase-like beta-hydroxyacid dehydrogenase
MNKLGFVGLGSMGAPLAARLLPGYQVQGTNRTKAKAAALIEQGLIWQDTPREAAVGAQVVFSMVTDDAALAADSVLSQAEQLGYRHRDIAGLFQVLAKTATAQAGTADSAGPKAA